MSEILGSGLAFPLQVDARGALSLAGGEDDIAQAIELVLGTAPGERDMRPEFGCAVHDLEFDLSRVHEGQLLITINYRVRSTNNQRNLVYPFYVIPEEESE